MPGIGVADWQRWRVREPALRERGGRETRACYGLCRDEARLVYLGSKQ
jgi:hypothetical protein